MNKIFPISAERARQVSRSVDWLETSEAAYVFRTIENKARDLASKNLDIEYSYCNTTEVVFWGLSDYAKEALCKLGYRVTSFESSPRSKIVVSWRESETKNPFKS